MKNIKYLFLVLLIASCTDKKENPKTEIKPITYNESKSFLLNNNYQEEKNNFASIADTKKPNFYSAKEIFEASNALILINANNEYTSSHYSNSLNLIKQISDSSEWAKKAKDIKTSINTILNKSIYEYAKGKKFWKVYEILSGIDKSYENYDKLIFNLTKYNSEIKSQINTMRYHLRIAKKDLGRYERQISNLESEIQYFTTEIYAAQNLPNDVRDARTHWNKEAIQNRESSKREIESKRSELEKIISDAEEYISIGNKVLELVK